MNDITTFSYKFPRVHELKIDINLSELLNNNLHKESLELLKIYEKDYLFIPKNVSSALRYLNEHYDQNKIDHERLRLRYLEKKVFGHIDDVLSNISFTCTKDEAINFFQDIIDEEHRALNSTDLDPTLQLIMSSKNPEIHLRKLIVQFAIEFLSEGSAMTQFSGGSFGPLQSSLFRILIDEMGEGIFSKKHSRLYEQTMSSIGYSDICGRYKDYFDTSMLHVTNYIYYLSSNKKYFFRFLGSVLRNEACFINWQKQLGIVSKQVFGEKIDQRYFDVHALVDQDHGNWSLETLIKPAIQMYGEEIIPEIMRGYIEYTLYQDINNYEFCYLLKCYDDLESNILKVGSFDNINNMKRYVSNESLHISRYLNDAQVKLAYDGSLISLKENKELIIPKYFPIYSNVDIEETQKNIQSKMMS